MTAQVMTNHHVTFSNSNSAIYQSPQSEVSRLPMSASYQVSHVEHDNPFRPGSELIEEAESFLKNTTIVGNHVVITSDDSGVSASPNATTDRHPAPVQSPPHSKELQCSAILSSTLASSPGDHLDVKEDIVRVSPESNRPESPAMRAEHVVVSSSGIKTSPSKQGQQGFDEPDNPFKTMDVKDMEDESGKKGKKKKNKDKKKKKCSIL